ncbi:methylthioadenosine phosphorylase [Methanobacterium lacus]|uniref:Probable S-methyl-5'-thioinosine phosphorylase n=1 Tax=Methanobacterium lacus (strain AL-21) TaxID=877455 RepID=F0T9Y4_METLA|nr:S-methyl-5'-thioadenosine phosphorylase [Methanobacterium lacus]ADZ08807.1 methylthioadenosine phosphorylase [Methanobacterium lacus]
MIGIIGGTGIYEIVTLGDEIDTKVIKTPYGKSPEVSIFELHGKDVVFMPRHAKGHSNPPHMVNYRANVYAMKELGVERIIATNAVGSLEKTVKPGDFMVPNDFIDFTKLRPGTFYDSRTVHVDVTEPYCNYMRRIISSSGDVVENGVYVCTEGPRFETPAEIQMFKLMGGTVVGMTGIPEAVLARELEICYASICTVSNYAASISPNNLTIDEVFEIMEKKKHDLVSLMDTAISKMGEERDCDCKHALKGAEI